MEVTLVTVGTIPSITMSLLTAKEPAAPIAGSVRVALHLKRHLLLVPVFIGTHTLNQFPLEAIYA